MEQNETQDFSATEAVETTTNEAEVKAHPAWDKMLAELPEVLHGKVTPYLQEQDRNFQQQLEKYTPFKDFVDQGITPDVITSGLNLAYAIENSPTDVYESLQEYLVEQGMLKKDAKEAARNMMEEESGEEFENLFDEDEIPSALKKELAELRDRQSQQDDYIYQQELAKETEVELQTLTSEMDSLKTQYQISDAHEIAIYDIMQNALNAGREITINEAAGQLSQMVGGFVAMNAQPNQSAAPTIMGSEGGAGVQSQKLEVPKSDKEKRAMLAQMFEEYQRANSRGI
jgi:hypothetical protein